MGPHMTPGNVILKTSKMYEKILLTPRTFSVIVFFFQLTVEIEDEREAPWKPSNIYTLIYIFIFSLISANDLSLAVVGYILILNFLKTHVYIILYDDLTM